MSVGTEQWTQRRLISLSMNECLFELKNRISVLGDPCGGPVQERYRPAPRRGQLQRKGFLGLTWVGPECKAVHSHALKIAVTTQGSASLEVQFLKKEKIWDEGVFPVKTNIKRK